MKENKAQRTSKIQEDNTEEDTHVSKSELENEDAKAPSDKRPRVGNDTIIREDITLDTIAEDLNISLLHKKNYKSVRN